MHLRRRGFPPIIELIMMEPPPHPRRASLLKVLLVLATGVVLVLWLEWTPPGLLGKADAVAYAVCHRISLRSFHLGDRQLPLCARCSGMYLGALIGLLYQLRQGKRGAMPPLKISIVLAAFLLAFGVDGINSYLHLFPHAPSLYEPHNWLRLATGTGLGIGIAAILYPTFNQSMWADWIPEPALQSGRQLAELLLLAGIIFVIVLSDNPLLLYPLALLSSATVLLILALIYTILWTYLFKQENRFTSWRSMWPLLLGGFLTALVQVAIMDVGRYALTGTWAGFFSG